VAADLEEEAGVAAEVRWVGLMLQVPEEIAYAPVVDIEHLTKQVFLA
jgi:hypothetical protein